MKGENDGIEEPFPFEMTDQVPNWHLVTVFIDRVQLTNNVLQDDASIWRDLIVEQNDDWHPEIHDKISAIEEPHLPEVETAIALLVSSGQTSFEEFGEDAQVILSTRCEIAASFLYQLYVKDPDEKGSFLELVNPGQISLGYVVKWLLTDWWNEHGKINFARQWIEYYGRSNDEP